MVLSVNVYAANSYSDDFDDGNAEGWTPSGGSWSISNSGESSYYYQQTDTSSEFFSYAGQISWTDYSLEAKVKRIDTDGWGSCDFVGRRNGADFYLLQLGSNMASLWRVMGDWERLQQASTTNTLNTWYTYKLEMVGDVITVYKDGAEIISLTDPNPILSGQIGFRTFKANCRFDDVFVANLGTPWPSGQASNPIPSDEETDVPRDVVLSWTSGEFAATHDVYLGTVVDDVNNASRSDPGSVLISQDQIATAYEPGRLGLGQTYYWRIDEVNAPPDSTIFKGDVWSFTIEPLAYPIENITATASSSIKPDEGPENTVNGSGMDDNDLHSTENTAMWLSSITGQQPTWIQYEFDRAYKLHQMWVWNYNASIEPVIGFGVKEATIEYSADGTNWTILDTTHKFNRAPGAAGYAPNTTIDLGGGAARYVKITANSNWGGMVSQFGLSEVRFFYIPVLAKEPNPVSGATDIGLNSTLSWKVGREAARHDIYISSDEQAVIDGTALVATVTEPRYGPLSLDLGQTYYWRIDEVNMAEIPTTWEGDIWEFATQESLVVEDFESYNDIPAGEEGSNLIYGTWADGFDNPANGSTIGYNVPFQPTMETQTVHGGKQSVPLTYNNSVANLSEVTVDPVNLVIGRDWTTGSPQTLGLWFYGDPANAVTEQMYVKVNGVKVTYPGDGAYIAKATWTPFMIDLAALGIDLSNVTQLSIGFERTGAAGGSGTVLIDDILLYGSSSAPQ